MALKLSKEGYYDGNPESVLQARVDHVLAALEYEKFQIDYEVVFRELNK